MTILSSKMRQKKMIPNWLYLQFAEEIEPAFKTCTMNGLNLERLTVRLGLTVIYFPIFRQARPDFFRVMNGPRT